MKATSAESLKKPLALPPENMKVMTENNMFHALTAFPGAFRRLSICRYPNGVYTLVKVPSPVCACFAACFAAFLRRLMPR